jgi:hypothetical protein
MMKLGQSDMMRLRHFSQFCEHAKKWVKTKGQTQNNNIHKLWGSIIYLYTNLRKGKKSERMPFTCSMPYTVDTKEHKQKRSSLQKQTWKKSQLHSYSICKVSDFNQIKFPSPSHYTNSVTLGRNPTSTVTTAC